MSLASRRFLSLVMTHTHTRARVSRESIQFNSIVENESDEEIEKKTSATTLTVCNHFPVGLICRNLSLKEISK